VPYATVFLSEIDNIHSLYDVVVSSPTNVRFINTGRNQNFETRKKELDETLASWQPIKHVSAVPTSMLVGRHAEYRVRGALRVRPLSITYDTT
jgi:hypothetical protein